MYGKLEVFPKLIFHYKINKWENIKKNLLSVLEGCCLGSDGVNNLLTNFHEENNFLNHKIQNLLQEELNLFKRDLNLNVLKIKKTWFQEYKNTMNHTIHTHGAYGYSAIVYIKFDEKIHPTTTFIDNDLDFLNADVQCFEPNVKEGSLLLFPSNLKHFVKPNNSKEERIILSFNLDINNVE